MNEHDKINYKKSFLIKNIYIKKYTYYTLIKYKE